MMRLLSEADIEALLDPPLALAAADEAYRLHAAGGALGPGRIDLRPSEGGAGMLTLAAFGSRPGGPACVKTNVHVQPDTAARRHGSLVTLWDVDACRPRAILSGLTFNRRRTAAGFASACRLLARQDAARLTVFGAGAMAPETVRLICAVRPIREVLIVGRDPARAAALAARLSALSELSGVAIRAETDPRGAAGWADVIVAVTSADAPVFPGEAVRDGTFVVLGGANRPTAREADDVLIGRAAVFVDHLDGCLTRAGDLALPLTSGALRREAILGEIGAFPEGRSPVCAGITVFKSIGVAMQDLVLAQRLVERAEAAGVGALFDLASGAVNAARTEPAQ